MSYYLGLDVFQKTTYVCILDQKGKRILENEVDSNPEVIPTFLLKTKLKIEQIGLERGNITHYLKTIHLVVEIKDLMQKYKHKLREDLPKIYSQDLLNHF